MEEWEKLESLAKRLRWARRLRKMTQAKLAKKAGNIAQSTIANFETKEREKPRNILEIATALDVDATWLLSGVGSPFIKTTSVHVVRENIFPSDYINSEILKKLIKVMSSMDIDGQELILEHAEELSPQYLKHSDFDEKKKHLR